MKKLWRLCMVAALAVSSLSIGVTSVAAQDRTCFTSGTWNFSGLTLGGTYQFDRIVSDITVTNTAGNFSICEPTPTDSLDNGPSAWVSIEPGGSNPYHNSDTAIVQVGIIKCSSATNAICRGDNSPRFFWAVGGCNGYHPFPRDLGAADSGRHQYKVAEGTSSWFVYIDGTSRASVLKTDPAINCWINYENEGGYWGEKWDKGDSLGESFTPTVFSTMQYRYRGFSTFTNVSTTGCSGATDPVRDFCSIPSGSHSMYVWTDQP